MTLQLPLDPRAPACARAALSPLEPTLSPQAFDDLQLLVSELAADCVAQGEAPGRMDVRTVLVPGQARVEVTSNAVPQVDRRVDRERTRRLDVIRKLATACDVRTRGSIIIAWAVLDLK